MNTYTVAQAARLLRVSKATILRRIKEGELNAAKVGGVYRISKVDLQAFYHKCGGVSLFGEETNGVCTSQVS